MHVPQDSMWREILKSFWFLSGTKQGLSVIAHKFYVSKALFSSDFFLDFGTVAFSFLFDKHYPIMF